MAYVPTEKCDKEELTSSSLSQPVVKRGFCVKRLYDNPWSTWFFPGFLDVCRTLPKFWMKQSLPTKQVIDNELPVESPDQSRLENPPTEPGIQFTWLGHASCLVQLDKTNVLADPITSDRCSFASFLGEWLTR